MRVHFYRSIFLKKSEKHGDLKRRTQHENNEKQMFQGANYPPFHWGSIRLQSCTRIRFVIRWAGQRQ